MRRSVALLERQAAAASGRHFEASAENEDMKVAAHCDTAIASYRFVVRIKSQTMDVLRRLPHPERLDEAQRRMAHRHETHGIRPGRKSGSRGHGRRAAIVMAWFGFKSAERGKEDYVGTVEGGAYRLTIWRRSTQQAQPTFGPDSSLHQSRITDSRCKTRVGQRDRSGSETTSKA